MWKCPKCIRTFKNENRSDYCGKVPGTIDEYIHSQDEGIRRQIQNVRDHSNDLSNKLKALIEENIQFLYLHLRGMGHFFDNLTGFRLKYIRAHPIGCAHFLHFTPA